MNLLIGIVLILCLVVSEMRDPVLATDILLRLMAVAIAALSVPGLAMVQTLVVSRRCNDQSFDNPARHRAAKRLAIAHSIIWITASLAIVWSFRWPDIVRVNWRLDQIYLLDELLILAPILLSLVFSWAILYDVQRMLLGHPAAEPATLTSSKRAAKQGWILASVQLRKRLEFVSIRFRTYVLMALIPLVATLLARDFTEYAQRLPSFWQAIALSVSGLVFLAVFPLLMLFAWKSRAIEEPMLRKRLLALCRRLKIGVFDIRIWQTGNQMINAVVAGILPGCRIIMISDALVEQFPRRELLAVVRHEAGHIRLCHLPIRLLFILFPLVLTMLDHSNPYGVTRQLISNGNDWGVSAAQLMAVGMLAYFIYLIPILGWLAYQMEYEADWYSVQTDPSPGSVDRQTETLDQHDSMTLAIARLAAHAPQQYERRTLMHPSLKNRLQHTVGSARRLRRNRVLKKNLDALDSTIRFRQRLVAVAIVTIAVTFLLSTALSAAVSY